MATLADFVNLPAIFRNRYQKVNAVQIQFLSYEPGVLGEDWLRFNAVANAQYPVTVEAKLQVVDFDTGKSLITYHSPAMVMCQCQSFHYEFASVLKQYNALLPEYIEYLTPEELVKFQMPPRKKNKQRVFGACKHIIKFIQVFMNRRRGTEFITDNITDPKMQIRVKIMRLQRKANAVMRKNPVEYNKIMNEIRMLNAKLGL